MCLVHVVSLWLFTAAAAYTDFRHRKVPNRLLLCAGVVAAILSACRGWASIRGSLAGMSLGLLLLLPAFLLGMVGGGDVKSLAVAGIFTGPHLLWVSFLRGAAIGGFAGLTILAARRFRSPAGGKQESGEAAAWTLPYAGIFLLCIAVSALLGPLGGHPQPL